MATKILMVCLGNICRSPLAEGIVRHRADPSKITVDSAGTGGYHIGEAPDSRSIAVSRKYGIDISKQRCRKFIPSDFDAFDRIYAMDRDNYANIVALARTDGDRKKVRLLLSEIDAVVDEVPDPYYGGKDGFEYVFGLIDEACKTIIKDIEYH